MTIIGPGAPGAVRASVHVGSDDYTLDVPSSRLPEHLRLPNAKFVALVEGRELVRVEAPDVEKAWIEIQNQMRRVLNEDWDPIGVAGDVDDEYDLYIADLYRLVKAGASESAIATQLHGIERDSIELPVTPMSRLLEVATRLRGLQLPDAPE